MKVFFAFTVSAGLGLLALTASSQPQKFGEAAGGDAKSQQSPAVKHLYIDVHHLGTGNVNAKAAAAAHQKDLKVQKKYGVSFNQYWVDEARGDIYCLATSPDAESIRKTHQEAHGLVPDSVYPVSNGTDGMSKNGKEYFLDLHEFGPGNVNAKAVADAHLKDMAVQKKYGVNIINYWVNEKDGIVMCLAEAPDSAALVNTHKEAHGLVPVSVTKVKQGQ